MKTKKNIQLIRYSMLILGVLVLAVVSSCKKTDQPDVATEKIILNSIEIKTTATLPVLIGKDTLLKVVALPLEASNGKLVWTSSNTAVASVDDKGRVKAISSGEATISASSTDGGARVASILVRAISSVNFVTDITVAATVPSIYQGEKLTLVPTIIPSNATYATLKWESSNPTVATVSETGVVTALTKGNVDITVSSTDGSKVSKKTSLVINEVIAATAIQIAPLAESLGLGESLQLTATTVPANATAAALLWSSSNTLVATVSATGIITAIAPGEATITVKNAGGVQATVKAIVDEGKINDTFFLDTNWRTSTSGATATVQNGVLKIAMNGKRGDAQKIGGATVHAGKYPVIAFKFNRPLASGGNIILDTNMGRYMQTVNNGNNQMTILTGKDGVQVHYANIAEGSFSTAATKLSTTGTTVFTSFTCIVADFPFTDPQIASGVNKYDLYWVKSFKSVADLQAYIAK
jgi:uncharacterized protein YjdB